MKKVLLSALMAVALVAPALAHHSPAAFDRTKKVTLVGTVKEFRWQNPHTWIEVEVPDEKDKSKIVRVGRRADEPDLPDSRRLEVEHHQAGRQGDGGGEPGADRRAGGHLRLAHAGRRPRRCSSGPRVSARPSRSRTADMRMMSPIRIRVAASVAALSLAVAGCSPAPQQPAPAAAPAADAARKP